ncbi:DNA methyltransferase [Nostoc favosum]|uniref:site-specific DNA-methyltransferase (adenine-specific) n=1 Tax=Nostoc favosum CHAB5714 TaxID=2780399 RepID=A0ABS8I9Z7_9NOSO|nr:DNA methyltransferase [Nostoc favosum]MCC5600691.1 SAM-dependent methyltransferase [Nostoc favosum CHAB5714]
MSYLTPEAKSKLSSTIRALRERLLTDLQNAVESTYRLSITAVSKAGLAEEQRVKRQRLEQWLDEQSRSQGKSKKQESEIRDRYLKTAVKLAAATLLNRLIVIKQMEAHGLSKPAVLTGGWQSRGYREFRDFAPDLCKDETEGYGTLLQLLYDELAQELPGLFGNVGVTALFPIPASTLRAAIEALDASDLRDVWLDDTTLGWVYQYWNDPEREALDAKLNGGGKVEPHEIASKTQMFTERYMVEWLLHNSLGQMWLAMCKKHGWTAEVEADGTLARLEARRKEWREKREQGQVAIEALMPIEPGIEENWKYWVPQPLTADAVTHAPESVRSLKILDPATGSAHFLVIAFGLLFTLYQEEARHRGENWSDRQIVESILENNLYGVDIDPRAIQIAAAALILKARLLSPQASPKHLNLVASNLQLASLPADDPALVELRREVTEATGIPEKLTNQIVYALQGADYLGTLLKVDTAVDAAISEYESHVSRLVMVSLNPSVSFQVGDVNRLPLFPIESSEEIFTQLDAAFTEHEAARETSVEFKKPVASVWNYAQEWAQTAVDRKPGTPLPKYEPVYEDPPPTNFVSYAIGVALGRFGANGEGILNQAPATALPHGILYLSAYSEKDSLEYPSCKPIQETWYEYGSIIAKGTQLRKWLRLSFFKEVHLGMYESRPIYFPLSSPRKNFVAFVSIHRWADNTLQTLLADYLIPELSQLEGELNDLTTARHQGDKKTQAKAEERYSEVQKLHEELKAFIDLVRQCAEQGPPPANASPERSRRARDIPREVDARFKMDLDDGVMVNSAALWPLLEPQWNQPKKWWSELCNAEGKKDYDWSHLAARYFPKRVDGKCKQDPSLAVAHGCFWKYHPAKAYEWELRLQDEISEDFTIEETNSDTLRLAFARENPHLVQEIIEKEEKRQERKRKKEETQEEDYGPLFEQEEEAA